MKASAASSTAICRPPSSASCAPPRPDRFGLTGPSRHPDPRVNAYRRDIADVALSGILFAPHYAAPVRVSTGTAAAMLHEAPDAASRAVSQLLPGDGFDLLDASGGWAWGRCTHDSYVGYVRRDALAHPASLATHRVTALAAPLFAAPDIKSAVRAILPIGSRLAGEGEHGFLRTPDGFVHGRHVASIDEQVDDPVAVAERLVGQPYVWGGRGGGGIDCSGLVQLALGFAGIAAPRDSDMQRDAVGDALGEGDAPHRGDIVFFPGHVGMMTSATDLIHATAHHMAVVIEPLADVVARLAADHPQPILARRRRS